MTSHLSQDAKMLEAYNEGKDLYAMIAQSAFDNEYGENLEFWPEGTELEIDGKKVIAGNGSEKTMTSDETNSIIVPNFYLVDTTRGELAVSELAVGDQLKALNGNAVISNIDAIDVPKSQLKYLKLTFKC